MIEPQFHFDEHPVASVILMAVLSVTSIGLHFAQMAKEFVPFFQIAACCMTMFVGYRTIVKKKGK